LKGTGFSPSVSTPTKDGALAPEGTALPTIRYSTAQNFFTNIETHLNPNSPTWDYDSIAKGYTPPPSGSDSSALKGTGFSPSVEGKEGKGALAPEGQTAQPLIGIPTWNSELYFEYHRGIYTSQAAQKRNIRISETATLNAEKLASLAWLDGVAYPNDTLTENWKKITFNQFHDLAAGSGIATIYRDAQKDFTEVFNADRLIDEDSVNTVAATVDTSEVGALYAMPVLVMNTLAWRRSNTAKLLVQMPEDTAQLPPGLDEPMVIDGKGNLLSQTISHDKTTHRFELLVGVDDMPPMGYRVISIVTTLEGRVNVKQSDLRLSKALGGYLLANDHLQLMISSETGCITSLTTAEEHFKPAEFLASHTCANQLQTYADNPKQYDAWNIDPGTLDGKMTPIDTLDSIQVVADGPLRKTIEIQRTWQHSHFTQDISLDAGSDFVRVDTTVDWHEQHVLLKAAFPLAHSGPKATFEIPYGAIERSTTRNDSWEKAQFEVPALRWADLGDATQGVSILNDSKYGYDALGNTLRLTLLRSPTWPDPDADQGPQHFTYEIYPHTGPWQTAQTIHRGYELNTPLTAQQVFPHTGSLPPTYSFASIDEPNVILTAMKKAEDTNALIFRFYEATGAGAGGKGGEAKTTAAHLHIPPGALYAIETNLMETPLPNADHLPIANDTITLPIQPWQIRTLEVVYPK
jgi:alpha-mannosidase